MKRGGGERGERGGNSCSNGRKAGVWDYLQIGKIALENGLKLNKRFIIADVHFSNFQVNLFKVIFQILNRILYICKDKFW